MPITSPVPRGTRPATRVVIVAAWTVPLMVVGGFAWLATLPVALVLIGAVAVAELRALRVPAAVLAATYAVPYVIWKTRDDPAPSLSRDIHPGLAALVVAAALVVIAVLHLRGRRPGARPRSTPARAGRTRAAAAVIAVLVLGTGAACATAAPPPVAPAGHEVPALARAWVDGWTSDDPNRLAMLFTDDATYTDRAVGKISRGRAGVAAWHQNTYRLIPDADIRLTDAFRGGDRVTVEGTYSGHIRGAPRPFAVPLATVLQLRGEQILADTDYYDLADLLRQSGLPPGWTPPAG